jgi:hypothetical protein
MSMMALLTVKYIVSMMALETVISVMFLTYIGGHRF